jgi:3-methylcrotonyl-CoA carboxylase alpha subunit
VAEHELRIGDKTVVVNDADFVVEALGEGRYIVHDHARRWRVVVAGPPDDRWVFVAGRSERVELVAPGRSRARSRARAHDMTAPMPATVTSVLVEPGAAVEKGETVLMLEAMKMELPIRAARSGVVRAVLCRPGELVQPGTALVELEP